MSAYLSELSINPERTPTPLEIDELKNEVLCFTMASHLLWTFWAFVNLHQDIEFGYLVSIFPLPHKREEKTFQNFPKNKSNISSSHLTVIRPSQSKRIFCS